MSLTISMIRTTCLLRHLVSKVVTYTFNSLITKPEVSGHHCGHCGHALSTEDAHMPTSEVPCSPLEIITDTITLFCTDYRWYYPQDACIYEGSRGRKRLPLQYRSPIILEL